MEPKDIFDIRSSRGRDELGEVFSATHRETGEHIGLKMFDDWTVKEENPRSYWQRAVESLIGIGPARTPRIVGANIRETDAWLATHWVEGPTLAEAITDNGRFDEDTAATIGCGMFDVISELHDSGFVHGGVTPNKVILTSGYDISGIVITDPFQHFLYSVRDPVHADSERFIGLPQYFSPEQAHGEIPDFRSEIYVVGLILYELVTGVTPFAAHSRAVTLRRQMSEPAMAALIEDADIDVSQDFQNILNLTLDKNPENRPEDPRAIRDLLNNCRENPGDAEVERKAQPLGAARGTDIPAKEAIIF